MSAPMALDQYWEMETSELKPMELRKMVSSGLWRREVVLGENMGSATWSSPLNAGWSDGPPPLLLLLPPLRPLDLLGAGGLVPADGRQRAVLVRGKEAEARGR